MNSVTYSIPYDLMQGIVSHLSTMPAGQVRGLLNAIEGTCIEQDKARADAATAQLREEIKRELQGGVSA
jgi:hypothetical protein